MANIDYKVTMPDGEEITVEVTNKEIPPINIQGMSGKELEAECVKLFSNLGWTVKVEQIVELETGTFRPDIVLSDGDKDCGYVEVITSMGYKELTQKQEVIQVIMDKCKPEVFIVTNGVVFDIFYNGEFAGSQTTPPSIDTVRRISRLKAYYNAYAKMQKGKKDGE